MILIYFARDLRTVSKICMYVKSIMADAFPRDNKDVSLLIQLYLSEIIIRLRYLVGRRPFDIYIHIVNTNRNRHMAECDEHLRNRLNMHRKALVAPDTVYRLITLKSGSQSKTLDQR